SVQVSYIGFKTQELKAQPVMKVKLAEDSEVLDEVVVVGYGVVKKNDATGSVTAIKPDDMNKGLNTNATDMMQGKIAGVQVTSDGGAPGSGATIRIRGGSSLSASNSPLIVIDGLAMDNNGIQGVSNPLSLVNPSDIETFTVLKDASATAIYGSRASNGVIIITTKKGAQGSKPKFSYEGNVSLGIINNRMEPLSAKEYKDYLKYRGVDMTDIGDANTNWQDEVFRPAISTDHNFSVTGGTKNMPYRASIGYTLQNGAIKTSQMQRVTASLNLSPSFLDKHLTFNLNAKGMYSFNRYTDGGGIVGSALSFDPTQPVYDDTYKAFGGFYQTPNDGGVAALNDAVWDNTTNTVAGISNPVAALKNKNNRAHSGVFIGNLEVDYKIHGFEDLRLHANFGADYSYGRQPMDENIYSFGNNYYGWEQLEKKSKYNLQFNAYAQYYKDFTETQHFDIMAGYEWQHFYSDYTYRGWGLYPETNKDATLRGTHYNESSNESITENYLVSFFGRLNYIGWNALMLTATFRADGSSRFQKGHRWGYFPSVALGWKIKETFAALRESNVVSDFKLRLGYGITGQQDLYDDYIGLRRYTYSQDYAYYTDGSKDADGNYIYTKTIRPQGFNDELTWEKTTTYNAGIDLGLLNSRINLNLDYYYRLTTDLIAEVDIPAGTNYADKLFKNIGSLSNQGIEVMLNAVAIDHSRSKSKFKWDLSLNYTYNINKIRKLTSGEGANYFVPTGYISNGINIMRHQEGYASNTFWVYRTEKDAEGNYHIIDQDGNGTIDNADLRPYHHSAPDMTFGFQTKWQFYNVDIGISLRASLGNYVYNQVLAGGMFSVQTPYRDHSYTNLRADQIDAYNHTIGYAGSAISTENARLMDIYVENASFLRCDNITVGYSFKKENVLAGRVYLTVQNPFVITGYSGLDPEIFGGIDGNIYPRSMTSLVGLSLQF
ncbi:MAG: SusC/RagA family TonB-linked outer membrane protein, partial [Paludibacteraceae bacterium]|nr:SusC/RagA family TonB-linked outer membrane protein [Paludibacteraceae bacterium]